MEFKIDKLKDIRWRMENFLEIKDKNKNIIPFKFNYIQNILHKTNEGKTRINDETIKARQEGVSTYWLGRWFDDTIFHPNTVTGILSHKRESLDTLFEIIRCFYDNLPEEIKPKLEKDTTNELTFPDINSKIYVSLEIRSTTVNNLHISEKCLADDSRVRASLGALTPNGNLSSESTGNGVANEGYRSYMAAKKGASGATYHFFPWFIQLEYQYPLNGITIKFTDEEQRLASMMLRDYHLVLSPEQVLWRRLMKDKFGGDFKKEYPETEDDAFYVGTGRFFNGEKILQLYKEAQAYKEQGKYFKQTESEIYFEEVCPGDVYVGGGDPSEGANDNSVLKIYNVTKQREAYVFRARCGEDYFYRVCDRVGRYYNNALLAIESNHGHAVLLGLTEICHYPNLYKRDNTRLRIDGKEFSYGWRTDTLTRPTMLKNYRIMIEGDSQDDVLLFSPEIKIFDTWLLEECMTFVYHNDKPEAESGMHDDDIFASAICNEMYRSLSKKINIAQAYNQNLLKLNNGERRYGYG